MQKWGKDVSERENNGWWGPDYLERHERGFLTFSSFLKRGTQKVKQRKSTVSFRMFCVTFRMQCLFYRCLIWDAKSGELENLYETFFTLSLWPSCMHLQTFSAGGGSNFFIHQTDSLTHHKDFILTSASQKWVPLGHTFSISHKSKVASHICGKC